MEMLMEKVNKLRSNPDNKDKYSVKLEKLSNGDYYISEVSVRQAWNMRKQTYYYTKDEQREAEQHLDGCLWALELSWINDDLKTEEKRLIPGYRG